MSTVETQRIAGVATLGALGYTFSLTDGWSAPPNAAFTTNCPCRSRRNACGSSFGGRQARGLLRENPAGQGTAHVADTQRSQRARPAATGVGAGLKG